MIENTYVSYRIKEQIARFLKNQIPENGATDFKFFYEMIFGILKSKDVKITEIGRALRENCHIKHTIKRLYRNLGKKDYSQQIENLVLESYASKFDDDTILGIDYGDISKKYSEAIENLSVVRDGDTGQYSPGFRQIVMTGLQLGDDNPTVLCNKLFSHEATPETSITEETLSILQQLGDVYGHKGIKVMDRYFDSKYYYRFFESQGEQFVVRAKTNRKALKVSNGRVIPGKINLLQLAKNCHTPYKFTMPLWKNGKWKDNKTVRVGVRKVYLTCIDKIIQLIVVKGFGKKPFMLLSNVLRKGTERQFIARILAVYRTRWQCEEFIRFVKVEYNIEDVRTLNYQCILNLLGMVSLAVKFITNYLGFARRRVQLGIKAIESSKYVYPDAAKFLYYRLSEGMRNLLGNIGCCFKRISRSYNVAVQLSLNL
jgi:hypothetical protein